MTPTLTELEPRLTPSGSPFPEVPSTVLYLAAGDTLHCAGDGGGPRVVRQDAAGNEVWSVFVADPLTRVGVNVDAVKLLIEASGERVVGETFTPAEPPTPPGADPLANSVDGFSGWPRDERFDRVTFQLVDFGPTPYAVAISFDTAPAPGERRDLLPGQVADELYKRGIDPQQFYIAVGSDRSRIDPGSVRIGVELSGPFDPAAVAERVIRGAGL
jgi:hypothetical protein